MTSLYSANILAMEFQHVSSCHQFSGCCTRYIRYSDQCPEYDHPRFWSRRQRQPWSLHLMAHCIRKRLKWRSFRLRADPELGADAEQFATRCRHCHRRRRNILRLVGCGPDDPVWSVSGLMETRERRMPITGGKRRSEEVPKGLLRHQNEIRRRIISVNLTLLLTSVSASSMYLRWRGARSLVYIVMTWLPIGIIGRHIRQPSCLIRRHLVSDWCGMISQHGMTTWIGRAGVKARVMVFRSGAFGYPVPDIRVDAGHRHRPRHYHCNYNAAPVIIPDIPYEV